MVHEKELTGLEKGLKSSDLKLKYRDEIRASPLTLLITKLQMSMEMSNYVSETDFFTTPDTQRVLHTVRNQVHLRHAELTSKATLTSWVYIYNQSDLN